MNIAFQYWLSRPVLPGAEYGAKCMSEYAGRCGATHYFARHETFTDRLGVDPRWFDKLRPVFDPQFAGFDKVLVADVDVFPVDGITASIFDEPCGDFGMVEEPDQPAARAHPNSRLFTTAHDLAWAAMVERTWGSKPPRDALGRPRTWNAGVILLTREGREKLARIRPTPKEYVDACRKARLSAGVSTEQGYLNTLAFMPGVNFTQLSLEWNRTLQPLPDGTTYDKRTPDTKFVHCMLRAADWQSAEWHHRVVNRPKAEWLPMAPVPRTR